MRSTEYCSPKAEKNHGSCISLNILREIVRGWNQSHETRPIKLTLTKKELLSELRKATNMKDYEFSKLGFLQKTTQAMIEHAFRPPQPHKWQNLDEWLRTDDINAVMSQYERRYPTFHFLGVFPIDFDAKDRKTGRCIEDRVCRLNLTKTKFTRMGMVLNLDKHSQKGSHWVALYLGLDPKRHNYGAFFYNSVASPPPPEVERLTRRLASQMAEINPMKQFIITHNTVRKQFKNSQCGVFSMYFLTKMIEDAAGFKSICDATGRDAEMVAYRKVFYRPSYTSVS